MWENSAMRLVPYFATALLAAGIVLVPPAVAQPRRTADLLWQNTNGQVHYWVPSGGMPLKNADVRTPVGSDWAMRGIGDVNGDGTDDLVWQLRKSLEIFGV